MSTRLQVLIADDEYREMQRIARQHRLTVSAWVRQALRDLIRREPTGNQDKKLRALRTAALHTFPAPPIDEMLREIESGKGGA
jgi:predicted transcriptional regulator